jgi:hypothetical protein
MVSFRNDGNMADYYSPPEPDDDDYFQMKEQKALPEVIQALDEAQAALDVAYNNAFWGTMLHPGFFWEQTTYWKDKSGKVWLIPEMETSHIRNIMKFLLRRASYYYWESVKQTSAEGMFIGGDMANDAFDDYMEGSYGKTPHEWMRRQELFKKFHTVLRSRGSRWLTALDAGLKPLPE